MLVTCCSKCQVHRSSEASSARRFHPWDTGEESYATSLMCVSILTSDGSAMITASALPLLINQIRAQLTDLETAFGKPKGTLPDWERDRELQITRVCSGEDFALHFTPDRVEPWFACLGDDLMLRITISDDEQGHQRYLVNQHEREALQNALDHVNRYEVDQVSVVCILTKSHLTEHVSAILGAHLDGLFYFQSALESRINLKGVESLFGTDMLRLDRHVAIGVITSTGLLQGTYVTVIGLDDLISNDFEQFPSVRARVQAWSNARALRDSSATWVGFLSEVDPLTFDVRQKRPGLGGIKSRMDYIADILALLQFCTSVTWADGQTIRATVARPSSTSMLIGPEGIQEVTELGNECDKLASCRVFRWAFTAEDYDKVDIVRDLIEREVRGRRDNIAQHLRGVMPQLLEAARATYKAIRTRAFESYLQARDEAKRRVSNFVDSSQTSIDKLRTDMVNRALQFFAAIIAYLAVSVLQPGLPTRYKVIGLALGIVYIGLIGIFQMVPACLVYRKQRQDAEDAVSGFDILTPNERSKIISKLPTGFWTDFTKWFAACCAIYAIGAFVLMVALLLLLLGHK